MDGYWLLKGKTPVPASSKEWAQWFDKNYSSRRINKTLLGNIVISTVFLGLNHRFSGDGPPILFETLVFGGEFDQSMERYCTWAEAETGHQEMVNKIVGSIAPKN